MGKVKRSKNKPHKENPTGLTDAKDEHNENGEEPEETPEENAVQTILDQLQSSNVEEKFCGLQTFAMFIEDPKHSDEVIQNDLIRVAAPMMFDSSCSVRNAAAGTLRNFSTLGSQVCEIMVEQDVMTPLIAFYHEYGDKFVPKENNKNKYDEDSDTIVQVTNLLWNLCEYSEIAIKHVNESRILDILAKFLDSATFGNDITIAALQCLFVVTEDNKTAISKIKTLSEETLKNILIIDSNNPEILLQKVLTAGLLLNFSLGDVTSLPSEVIGLLMSILSTTLSIDHRMSCNQLSSAIPLEARTSVISPKIKRSKSQQQLENQFKSLQYLLEAQQTSVEIIANLCSIDESEDEGMDTDNMSDGEEDITDDASNSSKGGVSMTAEDKLPPEVTEGFLSHELFGKVWARTVLPPENTLQILKASDEGNALYQKVLNLRNNSFLCINNMISCLPIETLGGLNEVYRIWIDIGKVVFQTSSDNEELLESATSVMRAALDKIKEKSIDSPDAVTQLFNSLVSSDIELMLNGVRHCGVPSIRANLIRMVGTLSLFFVAKTTEKEITIASLITNFILDHCHKEHESWVLAESIDVLMDLYSEDETDALALKLDLVSKMNALVPILRNKTRQQKKSLGEHGLVVSTALTNLPRFIKYKKNRISKLRPCT